MELNVVEKLSQKAIKKKEKNYQKLSRKAIEAI